VSLAVVVPAHNAAEVLGQALASVAAQTTRPDEVIVVDDASTDGTAGVGEEWAGRLPVKVLHQERNLGPAAARHVAVSAATSTLIAQLDADDVWLPDHLATLLDAYAARPGLIAAQVRCWLPGEALGTVDFGACVPPPEEQRLAILERNFVTGMVLYGRDLYEASGGYRGPFRCAEDWDLWIRMIRTGAVVSAGSHATVIYRRHVGSLTAGERCEADALAMLRLTATEVDTADERAAVRRAVRRQAANTGLQRAYSAARRGRTVEARLLALAALAGPPRVAGRAVGMLVAPGWGVRQRDARHFEPRYWLQRGPV
jgi:hypothetical protein